MNAFSLIYPQGHLDDTPVRTVARDLVTNLGADYYMLVPWSHMEQFGFVLK